MHKWSLILNILLLGPILSSCVTSQTVPTLPHTPKQYIHTGTPDLWCRQAEDGKVECADELIKYSLYSVEDVAMMQLYILELNEKCEKWEEPNGEVR